jgi:glutaryl-CoA dehydrogenase
MGATTTETTDNQVKKAFTDEFESPDFYSIDDLLTEEKIMVRGAIREYKKKEINVSNLRQ